MATFSIACVKGDGKETVTFKVPENQPDMFSLSGRIYLAEYTTMMRKKGEPAKPQDVGPYFYGVNVTVVISEKLKKEIERATTKFFKDKVAGTEPRVGVIFECGKLDKPIHGTHPITGKPTLNSIVSGDVKFKGVEVAGSFMDEDDMLEWSDTAYENAQERSDAALAESQQRKVNAANSAASAALGANSKVAG